MTDQERFEDFKEWFDKQYASLDAEDEDLAWDTWQAAVAAEAARRDAERCVWVLSESHRPLMGFTTGCGNALEFETAPRGFVVCPFCGKRIEIQPVE